MTIDEPDFASSEKRDRGVKRSRRKKESYAQFAVGGDHLTYIEEFKMGIG